MTATGRSSCGHSGRTRYSRSHKEQEFFTTAHEKFKPTPEIAEQAANGGELREKLKRGGTQIGVARACDLKNGRDLT